VRIWLLNKHATCCRGYKEPDKQEEEYMNSEDLKVDPYPQANEEYLDQTITIFVKTLCNKGIDISPIQVLLVVCFKYSLIIY
jgi:hypothetical protein